MAVSKAGRKKARMGRPPGPPDTVRRNRVVVMLTDAEIAALRDLADSKGLPTGTAAYQIMARALRRRS